MVTIDQHFIPSDAEIIKSQILAIRDSGLTNMLDLRTVQRLAYEKEYYNFVLWIEENPKDYWNFIMNGEGL